MAGSKGDKYYDVFLDYHLWLKTINNKEIMDDDGFKLLNEIVKLGSIKLACEKIGISYRKAWNLLKKSENILGFQLVNKQRGGKDGGHTELSAEGLELLNAYLELKKDVDDSIRRVTKKFFHKINKNNNIE